MGGMEQNCYRQVQESLTQVATAVQRQEPVNLTEITYLAGTIVDSIQENDRLVVEALSSPIGPPLVTNLVNVGILCTKVGIGLGYYGAELRRLTEAALLHDIGIFAVSQNVLTKTGRLTPDERALVEQHPRLGYEVVRRLGADYAWLAEIVLQAHERGNGQGYPNRLKGREINELAQIIGLVDIFDALVSPRPYRRRMLPHEAIRELLNTERTAFPREIMKALVEQLSLYPLGTKVRLSSGEEGIVVRITPRYPSRPIIRVTGEQDDPVSDIPRCLDLSLLPHVSVVETIDSPSLGRVTFASSQLSAESSDSSGNVSDQFAALLESLDAIATVIQTAVEKSPSPAFPAQAESAADASEQTAHIRREILGLFALEAREWLHQIQTALERLDTTTEQPRRAKLATIMWQSANNLARSAATVRLSAVEDMATTLLPILQAAGRIERAVAAHHVASLREGLLRIAMAVREFEPAEMRQSEVVVPSAHEKIRGHESIEAMATDVKLFSEPTLSDEVVPDMLPSTSILDALRQLHVARGRSLQPVRDVLETVIQRSEREMEHNAEVVDARGIGRILKDLDELDEEFLAHMQAHVPALLATLGHVGRASEEIALPPQALMPIFHDIDTLSDAADRVSAANIIQFLHGLRTFLQLTVQHKPPAVRERLAAVEERLIALVPLAQQWVDIGRVERSAIFEILPMA